LYGTAMGLNVVPSTVPPARSPPAPEQPNETRFHAAYAPSNVPNVEASDEKVAPEGIQQKVQA